MIRIKGLGRRTPLSVLDSLCSQQYAIGPRYIDLKEEFKEVLNTDFNFSEFWDVLQEPQISKIGHHPPPPLGTNTNIHLESWENHVVQFHVRDKRVLDALSEEEYTSLQGEFDLIKELVYQAALNHEVRVVFEIFHLRLPSQASRLNCEVSKLPSKLQVPYKEGELTDESPLVNLPNDLFFNVLRRLDTFDVFRTTFVCKKWKRRIERNGEQLTRAEHTITSHMVTFNQWMDSSIHIRHLQFKKEYDQFTWCLIRWVCHLSTNLETLILDQDVFAVNLASILQLCPKLKTLQIGRTLYHQRSIEYGQSEAQLPMEVHLPELEILMSYVRSDKYTSKLTRDLLISAESLKVFKGVLTNQDWSKVKFRRPWGNTFRNLIALDLERYPLEALETLSTIKDLKLKYLRLGGVNDTEIPEPLIETAELFVQLMRQLSELEVLIAAGVPGFDNNSIRVLIDQSMKLKFGIFVFQQQIYTSSLFDDPFDHGVDDSVVEAIFDFRDMLRDQDREIDLNQFHFYLEQEDSRRKLEDEAIGFNFLQANWIATDAVYFESQLNHPKIKKLLNIEF